MARQWETWVWYVAAGAVALVIGGVVVGTAVIAIPKVSDAEDKLQEFRQASQGDLFLEGTATLNDLQREVSLVRADLRGVGVILRWVRRASVAFSWMPVLDREIATSAGQMDRVHNDLDVALVLLESSSALLNVSNDAQSALLTSGAGPSTSRLRAKVDELEASFSIGLKSSEKSAELSREFGLGVRAPRIRGLTGLLAGLEERMLTASDIGRRVSILLSELLELADDAQPLIGQFVLNGSEPEPLMGDELRATLTSLTAHARSARADAEGVAAVMSDLGQADRLADQLDTLDQVLAVLLTVSNASLASLDVVEAGSKAADSPDRGLLNNGSGLIEILDSFVERREEFASAIADLDEARITLDDLAAARGDGAVAGGLADMSRLIEDLSNALRMVTRIAPVGREILGTQGPRRYLILGQSADELRATGGFVSSIWLATFEDGALVDVDEDGTLIDYYDSISVDDWDRIELYPKAPAGLEEHMDGWVWLLRDVSWEPDFPTTALSAGDMYRIGQRQSVDGVIALNQWTLLRLIGSLGEITPPGDVPVNSRNLLSVLEEGTDLHGRAYMDLVLQGVLDRLNQPASIPALVRLASGLHDTLETRDTLVFFDDPRVQSVMGDLGWDGRVAQGSHDYLYVVDSNIGWSKVDRNIQRTIRYEVDLDRQPRPRVSVTLAYNNHSGPSSPSCEPQWLNRKQDYGSLKNACYWNLVRVYVPQESIVLSSTPLPLPEYSVSVEIGVGRPGQDSGRISSSYNKKVFSGLTATEAGDRTEINLVYDLPQSVVRREGDALHYELLIQKQPGVRQKGVSLMFKVPTGYRLASSSEPAVQEDGSRVSIDLVLTTDTLLSLEFQRTANGSG